MGVLDVQSSVADALSTEDQLLLEGLCGQVATAIESTRLRQEMVARLDEIMESRRRDELETTLLERAGTLEYGFRRLLFDHDLIKAMKNDRDAFEHVIHAEEDVIRLFEGVARAEKSEGTRKMLAMLAEDEKEHLAEIEEIYEFIEKPHCYLEWGEFSNLKAL